MSLQDCPKMTAKCPHYASNCNTSAGDDCHYVKAAVAASLVSRGLAAFMIRPQRPDAYLYSEPLDRPIGPLDRLGPMLEELAIEKRKPDFHIE